MNSTPHRTRIAHRRAELMAELLLEELEPEFLVRPTTDDLGYDLLVGFPNDKGGTNVFTVEVKATEQPPGGRFQIVRPAYERITHSNVPGLLLIADVKRNEMYFGWLNSKAESKSQNVSVPLVELDDQAKSKLRKQLRAVNGAALTTSQ